MNVVFKKIGALFLVLASFFILVACNVVTSEVTVTSIAVEESSLQDFFDIDNFDLSSIEIKVVFSDGHFQIIPVTTAMLSHENLEKLAELGSHQITVTYEGKSTTFTLNLGYGTLKTQLMAIYELAVTGNAFSGTYEEWLESVRGPEGNDGVDGKTVTLRVAEGFIQWQYQGDATWSNLISLELLAGKDGNDGENGKEVVFQAANGFIQWQYVGDASWTNLVSIATLTGQNGADGREVTFRVSNGFIEWQYVGDTIWTSLIEVASLVGQNGKSAYQLYLEYNPTYTKTQAEWIEDLVNGRLADIELFTISFDSAGGTSINAIEVESGKTVILPIPTREGYTFVGWYTGFGPNDMHFTNFIPVLNDLTLYAKWIANEEIVTFTITWKNEDGSILKSELFEEGMMPVYTGLTPTKVETDTHTYEFAGWTPAIYSVIKDQIYTATFNEIPKPIFYTITWKHEDGTILGTDEVIAGELPVYSGLTPTKEETATHTFHFTGWSPEIVAATNNQVYTAQFTSTIKPIVDTYKEELNSIFGFDIASLLPNITTDDYEIFDVSEDGLILVYLDVFNWSEDDALDFIDAIDSMLSFDDSEDAWIVGEFFIYVYADDETYPGEIVYGIAIYQYLEDDEEPSNPVEALYYEFNIQNTTTTVPGSYASTTNLALVFPGSAGKVNVKVSYMANVTSAPSGLTTGMVFAGDVNNVSGSEALLEIDTLGNIISHFTFEIQARNDFSGRLTNAKVQTWNGSAWVDLVGGNFYSQISTSKTTITINNLNASKFRLLFIGSNTNGNAGQFMIFAVKLYQMTAPVELSWSAMVSDLGNKFSEPTMASLLPQVEDLSSIVLSTINLTEYKISGAFAHLDHETRVSDYIQSLLAADYEFDEELSLLKGKTVYTVKLSDDTAYALYIESNGTTLEIRIWKYDPVIELGELQTLSSRQSINEWEIMRFGQSGLPSTGTYEVLVIPVEIKDYQFPANYATNLNLVFNGTAQSTGWESVSSFYYKSSWGQLDLTFNIAPKYVTQQNKSYYQSYQDEGDQYVIKEALTALNSTINFADYDSNNDGTIDSVIFIYSVDYDYDTDPWWAWVFSAKYGYAKNTTLDGKKFEYYFWASYAFLEDALSGKPGLVVNAETYIHELGHLMGFPDLYSYDDEVYGPVGGFDMMDYNAGDHGPANKLLYGWLEPYFISSAGSYQVTLDSYSTDSDQFGNALLIPYNSNDLNDGNAFDEYLLIMFYTPQGLYNGHMSYNYILSNAAIVIYRVDARMNSDLSFWGNYFVRDNDGTSNFFVEILEVDKNNSIPSTSNSGYIKMSDVLTSGSVDLSSYTWHQGGNINVQIEITQAFTNSSSQAIINVTVN